MQRIIFKKLLRGVFDNYHKRLIHKYVFDMDHIYFRHEDSSDTCNISFRYASDQYGIDRDFSLCRNISENVVDCAHRMNVNLDKAFAKKLKKKQKTPTTGAAIPVIDVKFYKNGLPVSAEYTCEDVLEDAQCVTVHIIDRSYQVVLNAPWIQTLRLPNSILADFPTYPSKLIMQFITQEQCKFTWYRAKFDNNIKKENVDWSFVGEGFIVNIRSQDVGYKLKVVCEPKNSNAIAPGAECISTNDVEAGPGLCPFDTRHQFTKENLSGNSYRICTYNILADLYCDSDFTRTSLYPYCPPYALSIDYRKQLILKELLGYKFDIGCLQEVDCKVFDSDLTPVLKSMGYEGVFQKKGATVAEGLAVFYNKRFRLLNSRGIILGEHINKDEIFRELWTKIENNSPLVERICQRTTAVQATLLECADNENHVLLVANTHLYFHPDADHIRLLQFGFALKWVHHILQETKSQLPGKIVSLIFCGDFNSVPQCGIYQLMTTQHVPDNIPDWSSNNEEAVNGVSLCQEIKMASACGTPQYTNYTAGFADCLDYIFYQEDSFDVEQVIPLPSIEELQMNTALPSIVFPSDHIALVADLKLKQTGR